MKQTYFACYKKNNLLQRDLAVVIDSLPEVKLRPQTHACTVTFDYVVAVEIVYNKIHSKMLKCQFFETEMYHLKADYIIFPLMYGLL